MSKPTLPVDVVSDVVCPWCYVGKRRLEAAIAARPDLEIVVRWRPYFLNPWVPREGMARVDYLVAKFGSVDRYRQMSGRLVEIGRENGIDFDFEGIARQPNTLDCHRLILWSRGVGDPDLMKEALMRAYFIDGADLTDRTVLVAIAASLGMDPDATADLLASDADADRITREAAHAQEIGIDGVPCFIMGGVLAMQGAQEPSALAQAFDEALTRRDALLARRAAELAGDSPGS
jgi:predicted DsbA family dithiol-disulfide isomerase